MREINLASKMATDLTKGSGAGAGAALAGYLGGMSADTNTGREAAPYVAGIGGTLGGLLAQFGAFAGVTALGVAIVVYDVVFVVIIAIDRFASLAEAIRWQELGREIESLLSAGRYRAAYGLYNEVAGPWPGYPADGHFVPDPEDPETDPAKHRRIWVPRPAPKISPTNRRDPDPYGGPDMWGGAGWKKWPGYPGPPVMTSVAAQRYPAELPTEVMVNGYAVKISELVAAAREDIDTARARAINDGLPGWVVKDSQMISVTTGPRDVREYWALDDKGRPCQPLFNATEAAFGYKGLFWQLASLAPWLSQRDTFSFGIALDADQASVAVERQVDRLRGNWAAAGRLAGSNSTFGTGGAVTQAQAFTLLEAGTGLNALTMATTGMAIGGQGSATTNATAGASTGADGTKNANQNTNTSGAGSGKHRDYRGL
mgnify:CR=1 FL=1